MIWGKRRFDGVDYVPYFDRLEKLLMANGTLYREFIMVSTKTDKPLTDDYYLGVSNKSFLAAFDGFDEISESELPKLIDTLHIADATTENFKSCFQFKHDRSR
jgi:hypothetical protein